MLEAVVLLCIGLALLVWSADRLVFGSAALARNMGIAPLVIGMTILAMGSSTPEMMVSATAALAGKTDTAVGNVLGSNIANIALILGVTAMLKPLAIGSTIIRRELPLMLVVTLIAGALLWDNYLGFAEGVLLLVLFVLFLLAMLYISKKAKQEGDVMAEEQESEIPQGVSNTASIIWIVIGLALLLYSSDMVVESAVTIAKYYGMSDLVIGLTIIAVGTSLPELAASVTSVLKGEDDMAVGNIIGSNVFNILAVMGIPGILNPSAISPLAIGRDFYVMLGVSVLLLIMVLGKNRRINRVEGGILLICFIAYQAYLFYNLAA
ncbi:calcium/sodium antiporter [Photobacterium damselae subsp. piscicida]|uniref:Calcium/sodium antiporter n=1 Tax=Photobacterium damsela subsp. piscicida TaxID=38294 RepID=A0A1Q9H2P0_PHODP|nr:calcium/sodium antiporter [Photobacterium damselae]MBE8128278.1 calcium/sodium antiporter [Photobacterium damselae subsp. piscicida]MDP2515155.1 calcium/sodium antiporter [Photobacterium damselae subsp. piscicida]MDP2545187.1 calcium/sodium antiporter [Photobacterium damselae subsp. piscicida]MDP2568803.1 calcium/sodium antiporter [Photobacterium damselae subsp. piscicida]OLQ82088.1 calcium/sodium antiporter [Photobacterium damselae subsp. piscicida]